MGARLPKKETGVHASYELGIDWSKRKKNLKKKETDLLVKFLKKFLQHNCMDLMLLLLLIRKGVGEIELC